MNFASSSEEESFVVILDHVISQCPKFRLQDKTVSTNPIIEGLYANCKSLLTLWQWRGHLMPMIKRQQQPVGIPKVKWLQRWVFSFSKRMHYL
jgi:hypothetical protein